MALIELTNVAEKCNRADFLKTGHSLHAGNALNVCFNFCSNSFHCIAQHETSVVNICFCAAADTLLFLSVKE
jgi:hypothetical protein